jgi:FtsH-binding integral membrane protein
MQVRNYAFSDKIDLGLKKYLSRVLLTMSAGVAVSAIFAAIFASSPYLMNLVHATGLKYVLMIALFGIVFSINKMKTQNALVAFWVYAALIGTILSVITVIYTGESIVRTLLVSSATFLSAGLYGYTTKKDLSFMGLFLMMGVFGLIICSIINMFMQSEAFSYGISMIGVLIFTGLTAYDMQRIRESYLNSRGEDIARLAVFDAFRLYLNFINLFMYMLRFLGNRKN